MMCMGLIALTSCTDANDWNVDSSYSRLFSPAEDDIAVKADATGATVTFSTVSGAEYYVIQVSNDSLFTGNILTYGEGSTKITSSPTYIENLVSDTTYFLRIKAVSSTTTESIWAYLDGDFDTKAEQIFYNIDEANDLTSTSVTLRWPANTEVTAIRCNGNTYTLSNTDIANGYYTISGLSPETEYTANIYNGSKRRGSITFTTAIDLNGAVLIAAGTDLQTVLDTVSANAVLALEPGTYETLGSDGTTANLSIVNNITIKSLRSYNRAVIKGGFDIQTGNVSLSQVVLNGNGKAGYAIDFKTAGSFGSFTIDDCEITNYTKGLVYNNTAGAKANSITINNCLIHDMTSGADFLDFRAGYVAALTLTNSTVWNSTATRDFVRYDNSSANYSGETAPVITIDHNTLVGISNKASCRLLYVRYTGNSCIWTNNIVYGTEVIITNQSTTNVTTISGNNNYNTPNLFSATATVTTPKVYDDNATNYDPEFTNASDGDFTVNEAHVLKNATGDPRWIK